MAWLKNGSDWPYRAPISIDNTGGGAGAIDATITIPADWDFFWTTVLSSGNDIRIADADGYTLLTFDLDTFSTTNRTGTIEIDNYTAPAGNMLQVWLYWGYASASSGISAFVPAAAKTGYIALGGPVGPRIVTSPERPGQVRPRVVVSKGSSDTFWITWDFSRELQRRRNPSAGSDSYEEIDHFATQVLLAGANQAAMYTVTATRFLGNGLVRQEIKAGTDGSDYTIQATVNTINPAGEAQTLIRRCWLKVRDVDEA